VFIDKGISITINVDPIGYVSYWMTREIGEVPSDRSSCGLHRGTEEEDLNYRYIIYV
jgi:hypothetical protein